MNEIFDVNPYIDAKNLKAPWLKDLKAHVESAISKMKSELLKESEYEGEQDLANEKMLYKHFKDNCENNLTFGNWKVYKYFLRHMRIKVCYEMLGEMKYTKQDKEMYYHFKNMEINDKNKCKASLIKFNSGVEQGYQDVQYHHLNNEEYSTWFSFKPDSEDKYYTNRVLSSPYFTKFSKLFYILDDLSSHVKMLKEYYNDDFFATKERYRSIFLDTVKTEVIEHSITKITEKLKDEYSNRDNKFDLFKDFEDYCNKNDDYNKLIANLNSLRKDLLLKFQKTDTYKNADKNAALYLISAFAK